jgi:hypothetical protein
MEVPKEIEKYLVKDEVVEKEFKLDQNLSAYASSTRILLRKRDILRDIDYQHISSIQFRNRPNWVFVLAGILAGLAGYFVYINQELEWALIFSGPLIFAGVILMVVGMFIWKQQHIQLNVAGIPGSIKFSGHRDTLDSLFKLIRERQE